MLEKHKETKKMDHEEHLYQLNSLIINLKGRPSVNYNQKKTAAQQAARCEETNSSKQHPQNNRNTPITYLAGKKKNTRQIITHLYLEDPE